MGRFDDSYPPRMPRRDTSDWGDWDPDSARRGYTGHVRALRDLAIARDPAFNLPAPLPRHQSSGRGDDLSPAALAISARAETADYLTVEYDIAEPGFVELYDAVIVPRWSVPFGRLLLSVFLTLPRTAGWQVLDVGCGTGYPTLELARFLGQDCDLAGIDIWEDAIVMARRKATEEWLRNVTFVAADVTASGQPDATFDTITCNLGLASFADRTAALGAMWRLLRPGGQLLVTLPLQSAMREFLDTYHLTLRDLKLGDYMRDLGKLISARPTIEAASRLIERAGFQVQRTVTDSFTLRFPDVRAFFTSPLIQTTYMASWRGVVSDLTIRRLVFNEVDRRLRARTHASGGELEMTVPMLCVSAIRI
ncbi:MAG: methyltransferase domain-containing protein [Ktedonobacterales bacterium]|nr:methyltransferase domain-containing protein [Ktedonobacterales bacterium]